MTVPTTAAYDSFMIDWELAVMSVGAVTSMLVAAVSVPSVCSVRRRGAEPTFGQFEFDET